METSMGNIIVELYPDKAPITVANFLRYVDEKRYDGGKFYRVVRMDNQPTSPVKIEVIQGGLQSDSTKMLPPIAQETTDKTEFCTLMAPYPWREGSPKAAHPNS